MDIQHLLFSFQGRTRRLHYWLAAISVGVVVGVIASVLMPMSGMAQGTPNPIFMGLIGIIYLVDIYIGLALGAKRCHDRDKSAWFLAGAVDFVEKRGFRSYCALIDALAVVAVLDPTIIRTQSLRVGIETRGELTTGQTVVDRREHFQWTHLPVVEAASEVDGERFLRCLMAGIA